MEILFYLNIISGVRCLILDATMLQNYYGQLICLKDLEFFPSFLDLFLSQNIHGYQYTESVFDTNRFDLLFSITSESNFNLKNVKFWEIGFWFNPFFFDLKHYFQTAPVFIEIINIVDVNFGNVFDFDSYIRYKEAIGYNKFFFWYKEPFEQIVSFKKPFIYLTFFVLIEKFFSNLFLNYSFFSIIYISLKAFFFSFIFLTNNIIQFIFHPIIFFTNFSDFLSNTTLVYKIIIFNNFFDDLSFIFSNFYFFFKVVLFSWVLFVGSLQIILYHTLSLLPVTTYFEAFEILFNGYSSIIYTSFFFDLFIFNSLIFKKFLYAIFEFWFSFYYIFRFIIYVFYFFTINIDSVKIFDPAFFEYIFNNGSLLKQNLSFLTLLSRIIASPFNIIYHLLFVVYDIFYNIFYYYVSFILWYFLKYFDPAFFEYIFNNGSLLKQNLSFLTLLFRIIASPFNIIYHLLFIVYDIFYNIFYYYVSFILWYFLNFFDSIFSNSLIYLFSFFKFDIGGIDLIFYIEWYIIYFFSSISIFFLKFINFFFGNLYLYDPLFIIKTKLVNDLYNFNENKFYELFYNFRISFYYYIFFFLFNNYIFNYIYLNLSYFFFDANFNKLITSTELDEFFYTYSEIRDSIMAIEDYNVKNELFDLFFNSDLFVSEIEIRWPEIFDNYVHWRKTYTASFNTYVLHLLTRMGNGDIYTFYHYYLQNTYGLLKRVAMNDVFLFGDTSNDLPNDWTHELYTYEIYSTVIPFFSDIFTDETYIDRISTFNITKFNDIWFIYKSNVYTMLTFLKYNLHIFGFFFFLDDFVFNLNSFFSKNYIYNILYNYVSIDLNIINNYLVSNWIFEKNIQKFNYFDFFFSKYIYLILKLNNMASYIYFFNDSKRFSLKIFDIFLFDWLNKILFNNSEVMLNNINDIWVNYNKLPVFIQKKMHFNTFFLLKNWYFFDKYWYFFDNEKNFINNQNDIIYKSNLNINVINPSIYNSFYKTQPFNEFRVLMFNKYQNLYLLNNEFTWLNKLILLYKYDYTCKFYIYFFKHISIYNLFKLSYNGLDKILCIFFIFYFLFIYIFFNIKLSYIYLNKFIYFFFLFFIYIFFNILWYIILFINNNFYFFNKYLLKNINNMNDLLNIYFFSFFNNKKYKYIFYIFLKNIKFNQYLNFKRDLNINFYLNILFFNILFLLFFFIIFFFCIVHYIIHKNIINYIFTWLYNESVYKEMELDNNKRKFVNEIYWISLFWGNFFKNTWIYKVIYFIFFVIFDFIVNLQSKLQIKEWVHIKIFKNFYNVYIKNNKNFRDSEEIINGRPLLLFLFKSVNIFKKFILFIFYFLYFILMYLKRFSYWVNDRMGEYTADEEIHSIILEDLGMDDIRNTIFSQFQKHNNDSIFFESLENYEFSYYIRIFFKLIKINIINVYSKKIKKFRLVIQSIFNYDYVFSFFSEMVIKDIYIVSYIDTIKKKNPFYFNMNFGIHMEYLILNPLKVIITPFYVFCLLIYTWFYSNSGILNYVSFFIRMFIFYFLRLNVFLLKFTIFIKYITYNIFIFYFIYNIVLNIYLIFKIIMYKLIIIGNFISFNPIVKFICRLFFFYLFIFKFFFNISLNDLYFFTQTFFPYLNNNFDFIIYIYMFFFELFICIIDLIFLKILLIRSYFVFNLTMDYSYVLILQDKFMLFKYWDNIFLQIQSYENFEFDKVYTKNWNYPNLEKVFSFLPSRIFAFIFRIFEKIYTFFFNFPIFFFSFMQNSIIKDYDFNFFSDNFTNGIYFGISFFVIYFYHLYDWSMIIFKFFNIFILIYYIIYWYYIFLFFFLNLNYIFLDIIIQIFKIFYYFFSNFIFIFIIFLYYVIE